jgi:hypothetical protein
VVVKKGNIGDVHVSSLCGISCYFDGQLSELRYEKDDQWLNTDDFGFESRCEKDVEYLFTNY